VTTYRISVLNEHFSSSNEHECADDAAARKHALKGALAIGAEEILKGDRFFAADVMVEADEANVARFMIAIGTSPLKG
jgi:hypothetical protein